MHRNKAFFFSPHSPWSSIESADSSDEENANTTSLSLWLCGCSVSLDCVWHVSQIGCSLKVVYSNKWTFAWKETYLTISGLTADRCIYCTRAPSSLCNSTSWKGKGLVNSCSQTPTGRIFCADAINFQKVTLPFSTNLVCRITSWRDTDKVIFMGLWK